MSDTETDIYRILRGQRGVGAGSGFLDADPHGRGDIFLPMPPKNARTLEVGFGQGEAVRKLLEHGLEDVWGVDAGLASHMSIYTEGDTINPRSLTPEFAKRAKLLYMDVCHARLPFPDNWFDLCIMTETIEHLDNPHHVVMELKRVMKDHALLMISYPRWECTHGVDQYDGGVHSYVLPGLFGRDTATRFFMQCYFQHLKYTENGATAYVLLRNWKTRPDGRTFECSGRLVGLLDIFSVVAGNYKEAELYGFLKKPFDGDYYGFMTQKS